MASSLPPSPVSKTTTSAPSASNMRNASAVVTSKNVAGMPPESQMSNTSRRCASTCISEMGTPSICIRSRKEDMWGDTKSPTLIPPCRWRVCAVFRATDPLPLEPATWTTPTSGRSMGRPSIS